MRDRHLPRLCRSCRAPMARQEDGCWRCGAPWAIGGRRSPSPSARARAAPTLVASASPLAAVAADAERARTEALLAADRWVDEGGSLDPDTAGRAEAAIGRG
jgi:hypothetical protein